MASLSEPISLLSFLLAGFYLNLKADAMASDWVELSYLLTNTPNTHFMESMRNMHTCDMKTCKMSCDVWSAVDISILSYDPDSQKCTCYDYPYAQLYYYKDDPVPQDSALKFAVKGYLAIGMKEKAEEVA